MFNCNTPLSKQEIPLSTTMDSVVFFNQIKGCVLPLIFLSRFSPRHIYDFQPSHDYNSPNPMLKFISDKYVAVPIPQRVVVRHSSYSSHYGRTYLEMEGSHVMEEERCGK